MDFQTRYLRYFLAVADMKSFSRAAEFLGISQPALSLRIQSQEALFGFSVFDRSGRTIAPTEKGKQVLAAFREFTGSADRLGRLIEELQNEEQSTLRVGISVATDLPLRTKLLADFSRERPTIKIALETGNSVPLMRSLLSGILDVVMVVMPIDTRFDTLVLQWLPSELLVPEEWEIAALDEVPARSLRNLPVASFPRDRQPLYFDEVLEYFANCGARLIQSPDSSRLGMLAFAARQRAAIASPLPHFDEVALAEARMVRRTVDMPPVLALSVMRVSGTMTTAASAFWRFAHRMAVELRPRSV